MSGFKASTAQRAKIRELTSIVSAQGPCDPAHLLSRALGGCDHEDCVIPLTRAEHRAYDLGKLDILPHLLASRCTKELQHALGHTNGDLIGLLHRVTGVRWAPERRERQCDVQLDDWGLLDLGAQL